VSIRDAYTAWSATFDADANRTRDLDGEVTRRTLGDRHFGAVLEIGCGTGKNTALFADVAERVLALDFSDGMLAAARAKIQAPHVTFQAADLTARWPCDDASFDLVACNLVLEHIEHLQPVFLEAARCLVPGGVFYVSELHPFRQYEGTKARFVDEQNVTTHVPAFVHNVSDFLDAAARAGLGLAQFREWWHADDVKRPPRLVTMEVRR
jgi:malonyl-CoA O-methyltransferase